MKEPVIREIEYLQTEEFDLIQNTITEIRSFEKISKDLVEKLPPIGSAIPAWTYWQCAAIHVFMISQLEHLLKRLNKIERQGDIYKFIEKSSLEQSEKQRLLYLLCSRHPIVHNGGHPDDKFRMCIEKTGFKEAWKESTTLLTTMNSRQVPAYANLLIKLILNDVANKEYSGLFLQ
jgi:hypothetical protein